MVFVVVIVVIFFGPLAYKWIWFYTIKYSDYQQHPVDWYWHWQLAMDEPKKLLTDKRTSTVYTINFICCHIILFCSTSFSCIIAGGDANSGTCVYPIRYLKDFDEFHHDGRKKKAKNKGGTKEYLISSEEIEIIYNIFIRI